MYETQCTIWMFSKNSWARKKGKCGALSSLTNYSLGCTWHNSSKETQNWVQAWHTFILSQDDVEMIKIPKKGDNYTANIVRHIYCCLEKYYNYLPPRSWLLFLLSQIFWLFSPFPRREFVRCLSWWLVQVVILFPFNNQCTLLQSTVISPPSQCPDFGTKWF